MKICSRCGRDLEKSGGRHSVTCPVGQFVKKIDEGKGNENIRIAFPNDELKQQFSEMMARTGQQMVATKTFFDACVELDEDAPDFMEKISPHLHKFVVDVVLTYPNPNQFDADLNTLLGKVTE